MGAIEAMIGRMRPGRGIFPRAPRPRGGLLGGKLLPALLAAISLQLAAPASAARPDIGDTVRIPQITLIDDSRMPASQMQGKVVVVMFWATWCPVCATDLPYLEEVFRREAERGLRILAVSLDESVIDVRNYWKDSGFTMAAAMRTHEFRERFGGIRGTPTFYVLDRDSRLQAFHLGQLEPEPFEDLIDALLQ